MKHEDITAIATVGKRYSLRDAGTKERDGDH